MINDAFGVQGGMEPKQYFDEAPNEEARRFYDQLEESSRPLCEGNPHSALSVARNRLNRNDEGDIDPLFPPISIFNKNGRGSKKRGKRGFTDVEMQSIVTHSLLNCPEIQPYVKDKADWWVVIKSKLVGRIEIDNVLDVAYQNDVAIVQQQVDVDLETTLQHPQHILEEVSDDEILNVEEEISKNEENESFDDKEWDNNKNETTGEEEWKNDGIESSEEE
uniref:Uncharacterized protein n=1 Tax=Solanum tuberosum TaxID=4113 RepID=M1BRS7_SOLTU